jgi:hypothetical protein
VWEVLAVAVPVAVITASQIHVVDLAYLVRAGTEMMDSGHVLRTDILMTWTLGRPWLNQQWGAELLFGAVYRVGGWLGLAACRALLVGAIFTFVLLACRRAGATRRTAALLVLGTGVLVSMGLALRAQLLGMLCFSILLWLLAGRASHGRRTWWAVPLEVLWVNVHGSFFLGPLLLGLTWLRDRARRDADADRMLVLTFAVLGATLVNPFGPRVWSYVVQVTGNPLVVDTVSEWRPPSIRTLPGFLFFVSVAAVVALLARRPDPVPWTTLLVLGVFFAIGLTAVRASIWWELLIPVEAAALLPASEGRSRDPVSPLNAVLVGVLVLAVTASFVHWLPYASQDPPERLLAHAPEGIANELRSLLSPGERFFNAQEWGSWFELQLPGDPVLVDSRFELIPPGVWSDYLAVSRGREGWQAILDRWGVSVVALSRDQQQALIPIIRDDPNWHLVYADADGLVFTRS